MAESDNFILILIFFLSSTKKWGKKSQNEEEGENKVCLSPKKEKKKGLNSTLIFGIKGFIMLERKDKMKLQKIKNR